MGQAALEGLAGIHNVTRGWHSGREINTVTFDPAVGKRQRVVVLLNEFNAPADRPNVLLIVVDTLRASIVAVEEHVEVDVRGTLRPGLSARVQSTREGGVDFSVMSLHLASGSSARSSSTTTSAIRSTGPSTT